MSAIHLMYAQAYVITIKKTTISHGSKWKNMLSTECNKE